MSHLEDNHDGVEQIIEGVKFPEGRKLRTEKDYDAVEPFTDIYSTVLEHLEQKGFDREEIEVVPPELRKNFNQPRWSITDEGDRYLQDATIKIADEINLHISESDPTGDKFRIAVEAQDFETVDEFVKLHEEIWEEYQDDQDEEDPMDEYRADPEVGFEDIGGLERMKQVIYEDVIDPLNSEEDGWNQEPVNGVLLYGPPGTGKTMTAKAIASEVDANFYQITTDDVMGSLVGEIEEKMTSIYEHAEEADEHSIVYIDEIENMAPDRDTDREYVRRMTSTLLSMADGFEESEVTLIGSTNKPDLIDNALTRPGRLDKKIEVPKPDHDARKQILKLYAEELEQQTPNIESVDVNYDQLADLSEDASAADLELWVREVGTVAKRNQDHELDETHFDEATEFLEMEKEEDYSSSPTFQ
jgi:ATP-dependent 26S proteasome regulatory subunit